jgi:hypothetical protein
LGFFLLRGPDTTGRQGKGRRQGQKAALLFCTFHPVLVDPLSAGKIAGYFISEPFPLERAITEFFFQALSNSEIKPIFIPSWDGKSETLEDLETDSILRINIRRVWIEAKTVGRRTDALSRLLENSF